MSGDPGGSQLVLVVDDDEVVRKVVRTVLETDGWEVAEVTDGASALELAGVRHPALVILDVMLPGMDGVEVCRRLDRAARVVVLTARDDAELEAVCREAGADAFLVKPFGSGELLQLVGDLLAVD